MHALYELHEFLVKHLNSPEEEYGKNVNAIKLQIVQPILSCLGWDMTNPKVVKPDYDTGAGIADYAFFDDDQCLGFILVTNGIPEDTTEKKKVLAICKEQGLGVGIVTNGESWAYFDNGGNPWLFHTDDRDHPEKFLPHILHLAPNNIFELGEQIGLLIKTGKKNRLSYDWQRFNQEENIAKVIEDLFFKFRGKVDIRNPDMDFTNKEIKDFFQKSFSIEIKEDSLPNTALKVTMPDGKIIFDNNSKKVLINTIVYIGIEMILEEGNIVVGQKDKGKKSKEQLYLIEREPSGRTQEPVEVADKKYYVYTGSSNEMKIKQLYGLSKELGIEGMRVEQMLK